MEATNRAIHEAHFALRPRSRTGKPFDDAATRLLDIAIALSALIFFAPVMLAVALLIAVADPGPVFFAHRRVGRDGKMFSCLKFRTMTVKADLLLQELLQSDPQARAEWARDRKLRNDPRIIRFGSFIRRSSLDELPQLINVLRGEMSIVGPRPIVVEEIARYGRSFADYCRTRPGITGLWQISGRNDVSYRRRVALDRMYVRSKSFFGDLRIIAMTIPVVLGARGSY